MGGYDKVDGGVTSARGVDWCPTIIPYTVIQVRFSCFNVYVPIVLYLWIVVVVLPNNIKGDHLLCLE